ncbi:MAG: M48 family metallopeptidase [Pseudomonadota bacterium]
MQENIPVDVVRSARRRTLAIHVDARGGVEVRAPVWIARADIAGFVERHRDWIGRKVAEARAAPVWQPAWQEGGGWYWQGESVVLRAGPSRRTSLHGRVLQVAVPVSAIGADWHRAVLAWHRRAAADLLRARVEALFALHCPQHRLKSVEFRWMRATWGTCGGKRAADGRRDVVIRLNPWLAALPPHLCDAVLLHELAHVEHMHHGPAFYRRLARLDPSWREHDDGLKHWARMLFPVRTSRV